MTSRRQPTGSWQPWCSSPSSPVSLPRNVVTRTLATPAIPGPRRFPGQRPVIPRRTPDRRLLPRRRKHLAKSQTARLGGRQPQTRSRVKPRREARALARERGKGDRWLARRCHADRFPLRAPTSWLNPLTTDIGRGATEVSASAITATTTDRTVTTIRSATGVYPPATSTYPPEGSLRLKVKPRDAQVYVDGYFVGVVDEFDGIFQRLQLEAGPHRIEVRAPGFENLAIDVQIRWDRTTTVEEMLRRSP